MFVIQRAVQLHMISTQNKEALLAHGNKRVFFETTQIHYLHSHSDWQIDPEISKQGSTMPTV